MAFGGGRERERERKEREMKEKDCVERPYSRRTNEFFIGNVINEIVR